MRRLFLDDLRDPIECAMYMYLRADCRIYHEEWEIVRSYGQFINSIKLNGLPDLISFDYDLADDAKLRENLPIEEWFNLDKNIEYNGLDCVKWLIKYCSDKNLELPNFVVHSSNPDGTKYLNKLLLNKKIKE